MIPFDHSNISYSFYKAKAVKVGDPVIDLLKIKSMRNPGHLQEKRLLEGRKEYAVTTYEFLYNIASRTLFPDISEDSISSIVRSDNFNIEVRLKPVEDKRKNKEHVHVLLSAPRQYQFETLGYPLEKYVGLAKKTLVKSELSILEDLIIKVPPSEVIYWRNKIDELKENNSLEKYIHDIVKDFMRRPGFEPGP